MSCASVAFAPCGAHSATGPDVHSGKSWGRKRALSGERPGDPATIRTAPASGKRASVRTGRYVGRRLRRGRCWRAPARSRRPPAASQCNPRSSAESWSGTRAARRRSPASASSLPIGWWRAPFWDGKTRLPVGGSTGLPRRARGDPGSTAAPVRPKRSTRANVSRRRSGSAKENWRSGYGGLIGITAGGFRVRAIYARPAVFASSQGYLPQF